MDLAIFEIDKKDLYDVYMLEYKVSEVLKRLQNAVGSDSLNMYYLTLKNKLEEVVDRLLKRLLGIFEVWVTHHAEKYGPQWVEEEIDVENVFDRYIYDAELGEKEEFFAKKEELLGGTSVIEAHRMLERASRAMGSQALKEKLKAINYAIHVCHTSGLMLAYPGEDGHGEHPMEILRFLEDLTQGQFIPQWDKEIERMAKNKNNWYKIAQQGEPIEVIENDWIQYRDLDSFPDEVLLNQEEYQKHGRQPEGEEFCPPLDFNFSYYGMVDKNLILKIYELEYKISQLLKRKKEKGQLTDSENMYLLRLKQEADSVTSKLLNFMLHEAELNHVDIGQNYNENYKDINFQEFLSEDDSLFRKIMAVNLALQIMHGSGDWLGIGKFNHMFDYEDKQDILVMTEEEKNRFLDDLTSGKFIPQWDKEIERMAKKNNWYKIAQQLELFEYGDEIWPLSSSDLDKKHRKALMEKRTKDYEELQRLRRERGSYYEPQEFEALTSTLRNSALRFTMQEFNKEPLGHEIIGSWFSKNSRGVKPKDFDILITVDDVTDIVGEKILTSRMEFSGVSIDVFYTDGQKSIVPVEISPQLVEYQIKKIRGI